MAGIIVFVTALETKAAIGTGNYAAGKAPRIIQFVTNRLAKFAIWIGSRRHGLVLRIVELVNCA